MSPLVFILENMADLLRADGRTVFAERLSGLAGDAEAADFAERVTSLSIWGGSGSVVDAIISDPVQSRRFDELIVDLAEALDHRGIGTPRSRWVAQTIEDWLIANPM